jgi:hypothetical protein
MKLIVLRSAFFSLALGFFPYASFGAASNAFNPDVSVNILGLYSHDIQGSEDRSASFHNGLSFQEAELQLTSDVDPYFRANALFSMAQEENQKFGFDPEEVYFETISLPILTLKAGKFKAGFGKHNQLHTHAFPFIDAPLINQDLLEGEGLNDMGISAAFLIPVSWYSEITAQAIGTNNPILFNSPHSSDVAGLGYLKNLWDLSDSLTFEWGLYGTRGPNPYESSSFAYGTDLIFKWRPVEGGKYKALIWQTEWLDGEIAGRPKGSRVAGLASWLQYQFAERWWAQARGEHEGLANQGDLPNRTKWTGLLGFFPSEFSGFRVQFDQLSSSGLPTDYAINLQWNISIGAHPAHAY